MWQNSSMNRLGCAPAMKGCLSFGHTFYEWQLSNLSLNEKTPLLSILVFNLTFSNSSPTRHVPPVDSYLLWSSGSTPPSLRWGARWWTLPAMRRRKDLRAEKCYGPTAHQAPPPVEPCAYQFCPIIWSSPHSKSLHDLKILWRCSWALTLILVHQNRPPARFNVAFSLTVFTSFVFVWERFTAAKARFSIWSFVRLTNQEPNRKKVLVLILVFILFRCFLQDVWFLVFNIQEVLALFLSVDK